MNKKILILMGITWFTSGFSQKTLNGYEGPRTVSDPTGVRMLPGFHANSKDNNYGASSFRAIVGNQNETTQPPVIYNPSSGENYVYTKNYLVPVTSSSDYAPQVQSITYFDGLGRPKQSIAIKAGGNGSDIVTHIPYDSFGRQVDSWLPTPMASRNGEIQDSLSIKNNANNFYKDPVYFSKKILENSPLDRIKQQFSPGQAWNSNPITFDYKTNTGSEVKKYIATFNYNDYSSNIDQNGYYATNTLYKNIVIDEDHNETQEFKNSEGQTLLVRKLLNGLPVDTYYVYNQYNQLAYVIPPLAVESGALTDVIKNTLCYQYKYDGRNRLVEKKLPGKGWEYMVYNKEDQLVLTQDANLKDATKNNFGKRGWLFTKYDKFGRVAYTGFFANNGERLAMQNALNNMNSLNIENRVSNPSITLQGIPLYYSNNSFPNGGLTLLSVNYYDSYPTGLSLPDRPTQIKGQATLTDDLVATKNTKGLSTASFIKNINDDKWTKSVTWYDEKARPIGSSTINHLGGYTRVESEVDFAGVTKYTQTQHQRSGGAEVVTIDERFVYDAQNRLLQHYHKVNNNAEELLTDNTYNDINQLVGKKLGNNLENTSFDYNIRGWMTGINLKKNENGLTLDPAKRFSYQLRYNDPKNNSLKKFNGNISEVDWSYGSQAFSRYEYTYDNLNRLLQGNYKAGNLTTTFDANTYNESINYDVNGNIKTLKRYASSSMWIGVVLIDDLDYTYENNNFSNRLLKVKDLANNPSGYPALSTTNPMGYDDNGNMNTMIDKGISKIDYNYLNLPTTVTQNGKTTNYTYRADGTKVNKNFKINNQTIITDYLDGFVHTTSFTINIEEALTRSDISTIEAATAGRSEVFQLEEKAIETNATLGGLVPVLEFFPTSEGFYDYKNSKYIYQYKDHLGNVRLSYSKNKTTGAIDIEDQNDYYPFGMSFINIEPLVIGGSNYSPSSTYKNYKYNGKELQETGMYDYGARMYMPDIGRWGVVDPLAEETKDPYGYVWNNPIKFIDPDGRSGKSTDVRKNEDGSFTVMNAHDDRDTNVYVVDNKGKRTGEIVAQTVNPTDFLYTNEETGGFDGPAKGVTFRLNKLPSGDDLIDKLSKQFGDKWDFGNSVIGLVRLAKLSANGNELDIKADKKLAPQGEYSVFGYNGGNYATTEGGLPTITTARAVGNILFGKNMRSIYESNKNPGGQTANDFYNFAMPIVGGYNQFQNNRSRYISGKAGNLTGAPFYGEHKYSGTYIKGGYFRNYK